MSKSFMIKSKARNKPVERRENEKGIRVPLTPYRRILRQMCTLYGAFLLLVSCATPKLVEKEVEKVVYRDSVITRIDTVEVTLPPQKVKDYSDLKDTLVLSTDYAVSRSWVNQSKGTLEGTLETTPKPVEVQVPVQDEIHYRDSLIFVEKPYPVEVEKRVRFIPKFWRFFGILGIVLSILSILSLYLKLKEKGIISKIISIFHR